jgi:hypothetical protein
MDEQTRAKALETLDYMTGLVAAERLRAHMTTYFAQHYDDEAQYTVEPSQTGPATICNGERVCLLGALWSAHGDARLVPVGSSGDTVILDGVMTSGREAYLEERPALKVAFEALNEEAKTLHGERPYLSADSAYYDEYEPSASYAEALFEGGDLGRDDLLELIARARKRVAGAVPVG